MRRRHVVPLITIAAATLMVLLAGCTNNLFHPGQGVSDHGLPAPIILADTSPAHLDAEIGVTIGGYDAASRTTTEIAVQFTSGGRLVQFTKGETLACNGAQPTAISTGFDEKLPTSAVVNTSIICVYTSGHTTGSIRFQVPSAPTLISPTEGASVVRSAATPVRYQAQGALEGIVALGTQQKAIAHVTTAGQAVVDTSAFTAGPGSIALTQFPTVAGAEAPTFASLHTNCTAIAQVDVTWS